MGKNILGVFDSGDIDNITVLIDKLAESSFDYLRLEGDGVKLVIGKNGVSELTETPVGTAPASTGMVEPVGVAPASAVAVGAAPASTGMAEPVGVAPASAGTAEPGVVVIKSPSYGLFYAQPEPGAQPYVKVGSRVKPGDTVGLLEIMKTFNAVTSDVEGEVIAIHVKNEEQLEPGRPLVSVRVG